MFTLAKRFDDEGEVEEAEEEDIEFLEAGEDSAKAFESPEEPLDFIALLVEGAVVFPGLDAVGLWRNDRDHAQAEHQLPGFVTPRRRDPSATAEPSGIGPSSASRARPSGASCAWPGDRAKVMAVRAFAATR